MALPQNRQGVRELLRILEPRVLGKELPGFSCNCGAVHSPAAKATRIEVPGDEYPGQEVDWILWRVRMTPLDPAHGSQWSCGLSEFVNTEEVRHLFKTHFVSTNTTDQYNPYKLKVSGEQRAMAGLPLALRIMDHDTYTSFVFDWGREQSIPEIFGTISRNSDNRFIFNNSPLYDQVISILRGLQPYVYAGGPEPEDAWEPSWLMNYQQAVDDLTSGKYEKLLLWDSGTTSSWKGKWYTTQMLNFIKAK